MGSSANLVVHPAGALVVGLVAGLISVITYHKIIPALKKMYGYHDTCGVIALHCLPGILGAAVSVLVTYLADESDYNGTYDEAIPHGDQQWLRQLNGLFITLFLALIAGSIGGFIVSKTMTAPKHMFVDHEHWLHEDEHEIVLDEKPQSPTHKATLVAATV